MTAPQEPLKLTPPWAYYRRKGLSEMRPYVPGEDPTGISISAPDLDLITEALAEGRDPRGYIARNPKNHEDQWYVAQAYFDENLEPADAPARDDAAELRAALKALLDPEGHDPAYDPTFGPGEPSKQAVNLARAALAASEGRGEP